MCLPLGNLELRRISKGEHLGYEWEIVLGPLGYLCGYVRVLDDHPWFALSGEKLELERGVNCHGGVTFCDYGRECPTHGELAEWWIGFDCGHCEDLPDPAYRDHPSMPKMPLAFDAIREQLATTWGMPARIWKREDVEGECRAICAQAFLARQLAKLTEFSLGS